MKNGTKIFACVLVCLLSVGLIAVSLFGAALNTDGMRGDAAGDAEVPELPAGGGMGGLGGRGDGMPSEPPTGDPSDGQEGEITDGEIEIGGTEPELPNGGEGMGGMDGMRPDGIQAQGPRGGVSALLPVLGGTVGGALLAASLCILLLSVSQKRRSDETLIKKEDRT